MLHSVLIYTHVICGALVLLLGLYLMLRRKGTRQHVLIGWLYVVLMWTICLSAFLLIAFHRFSFFLMVVGVLTFHFTFVGVRVVRRNKEGRERWFDWAVSIGTGLFGVGLIGYGVHVAILVQGFHFVSLLSFIFGFGTLSNAWGDIQFFRNKSQRARKWWLRQHISAMGGSYIAAVTALAVQNGDVFLPEGSYNWLLWIIPGLLGGLIIKRTNRKLGLVEPSS